MHRASRRASGWLGCWNGWWLGRSRAQWWWEKTPVPSTQFPRVVARLAGTFRESGLPASLYICARPENCRALRCVRHLLSNPVPIPLCQARHVVARDRPVSVWRAALRRASHPFAGAFPMVWGVSVQIPVMACPRGPFCIPLCNSDGRCGAIRVAPACRAPYNPRFPGQPKSTQAPLSVPYADEGRSARRFWLPSVPNRSKSPPGISRRQREFHDAPGSQPRQTALDHQRGWRSPTAACRARRRFAAASRSGGAVRIGCAASRAQGSARPPGRRSASAGSAG